MPNFPLYNIIMVFACVYIGMMVMMTIIIIICSPIKKKKIIIINTTVLKHDFLDESVIPSSLNVFTVGSYNDVQFNTVKPYADVNCLWSQKTVKCVIHTRTDNHAHTNSHSTCICTTMYFIIYSYLVYCKY